MPRREGPAGALLAGAIAVALTCGFAVTPGLDGRAQACTFPPPVRVRTVSPDDGARDQPTTVRPRVTYATGAQAQAACGAPPGAPSLRIALGGVDGGAPVDAGGGAGSDGGSDVPGTWVQATDEDPRVATVWELRPSAPLLPHTTYELVDAYPATCTCDAGGCHAGAPAVFARFTTGAAPDTQAPAFGGLLGKSCSHEACDIGSLTCCGPYDHLVLHLDVDRSSATDDVAVAGIHLYVRPDGGSYDFTHPLGNAMLALADPVDSFIAPAWSAALPAGKYHAIARAFDTSGNEDGNTLEVDFTLPLASDPTCASVRDGGTHEDLAAPEPDLARDDAMPVDAAVDPHLVQAGCNCAMGRRDDGRGRDGPLCASLFAALLVGTLALRRRRRRR